MAASASASSLFSAYFSFTASMMMLRSMANELLPHELRSYISSTIQYLFTPLSPDLTLIINEFSGLTRNQVYDAATIYLRTKVTPATSCLQVSKVPRQKSIAIAVEKGEIIPDKFENFSLKWELIREESKNRNSSEKSHFQLTFNKKFKDRVVNSYLPFVLLRADSIRGEDKVVKLYSRECPYDDRDVGDKWGSINLEHPATFDTLAMEPEMKRSIMEDLDQFVRRKEFYKRVGTVWKRGYLLYGPPGTGKSSLIAAMANYLKFDIYDLDLTSIFDNSDLRRVLLATTNRSILVIEDIDCSIDLQNRKDEEYFQASNTKITLSGLLNFIDGLWSSCGDERIIIFTTNHKDRLDPALLRPGRMDMLINLSYCTKNGFQTLAYNYLGVNGENHCLRKEIESLIEKTPVTPAEVAGELMKSDDANVAMEGLVNFLKRKRIEKGEEPSAETNALVEVIVKFLEQKKGEIVKEKDEESYNAVVALQTLMCRIKQSEAEYLLEKQEAGVEHPEPKKLRKSKNEKKNVGKSGRRGARRK
ncbi:hypothetical protein UlMin_039626 [Ulmus minor]